MGGGGQPPLPPPPPEWMVCLKINSGIWKINWKYILNKKIYIFVLLFFQFCWKKHLLFCKKKNTTKHLLKIIFYGCQIKISDAFLIYYHLWTDEVLRKDNLSRLSFRLFRTKTLLKLILQEQSRTDVRMTLRATKLKKSAI